MPSTHQEPELIELHAENRLLRARMIAVRAVDGSDHKARCDAAAAALRRLLELPDRRPSSWEAPHVEALADELCAVLVELTGGAA